MPEKKNGRRNGRMLKRDKALEDKRPAPFQKGGPGGPGRPVGSLSKVSLLDARDAFTPLLPVVYKTIGKHLVGHLGGPTPDDGEAMPTPDCATCRHYVSLTLAYVFGKPTERFEVLMEMSTREAVALATKLGHTPEEAKAEVSKIIEAAKQQDGSYATEGGAET